MHRNKKVIIFDFDGTFYSGEHKFDKVEKHVSVNRRKFLPQFSDEEYEKMCRKFPNWLTMVQGADIVDFIYLLKGEYPEKNISTKAFWDWQQENIYKIIIDYGQVVDSNVIRETCTKYSTYIVSNSSPNHIKFYMKKLSIDPDWFTEIISNRFEEFDRTKQHYYSYILNKEKCLPQNSFVFGDSEKSDIMPAINLNMNWYLVSNSNKLEEVLKTINKYGLLVKRLAD